MNEPARKSRSLKFDLSKNELLTVLGATTSRRAAARQIGCSPGTLYSMMRRQGILTSPAEGKRAHRLEVSRDQLIELYEEHQSLRRVAQVLGVSWQTVRYHMRRFDIPCHAPGTKGNVGRLTVQERWNMLMDGETEAVIESMGRRLIDMSEKHDN